MLEHVQNGFSQRNLSVLGVTAVPVGVHVEQNRNPSLSYSSRSIALCNKQQYLFFKEVEKKQFFTYSQRRITRLSWTFRKGPKQAPARTILVCVRARAAVSPFLCCVQRVIGQNTDRQNNKTNTKVKM